MGSKELVSQLHTQSPERLMPSSSAILACTLHPQVSPKRAAGTPAIMTIFQVGKSKKKTYLQV